MDKMEMKTRGENEFEKIEREKKKETDCPEKTKAKLRRSEIYDTFDFVYNLLLS